MPRRLAIDSQALTARTGLCIPGELPIEQWLHIGRQIFLITDSSAWWLADWLVYGQVRYPNRYRTAMTKTTLDYQTLRNYAWVARKFSVSRRRDTLSFQHHAEVAGLTEAEQEVWLDRAEGMGWSTSALRRELKAARDGSSEISAMADATIRLQVPADRAQRWELAAHAVGRALTEWMCEALDEIALHQLSYPKSD